MNWSMMGWAMLTKSPNWASQMTRAWGSAEEKPYSKPRTANSLSIELTTTKWVRSWKASASGEKGRPVWLSNQTALRWLNVPRADVLAGEADPGAFVEKGAEGEHFAAAPVDAFFVVDGLEAVFHHAGDGFVDIEIGRGLGGERGRWI